ncbi:MAG: FixH family protein [Bacteroidota bacterium]
MNWGTKIAVLYSGFVVMILSLVFLASGHKVELVTDNYYEQELKHQEKIDKIQRSNSLAHPLTVDAENHRIEIGFPPEFHEEKISGTIHIYSPSDKKNDMEVSVNCGTGMKQTVPIEKLPPGLYHVQIDWKAGDVNYYNEKTINI